MIIVGGKEADNRRYFAEVTVTAQLNNPYARPSENRPVLLCRRPDFDLQKIWPKLKDWD